MTNKQSGQSLVEFIIIVPIFFIILSGIVSIFYLQNRAYMDFESRTSLSISQFLFEKEERLAAQWSNSYEENSIALHEVLNQSFNPSKNFGEDYNKIDGVFTDKNIVRNNNVSNCNKSNLNSYSIDSYDKGDFQFSTCTNENGYERAGFSFSKVMENFGFSKLQNSGSSVYFPQVQMQWHNRSALTTNAVMEFSLSPKGVLYSKEMASWSTADFSMFNKKCFMEPFSPQCKDLHPYEGKFGRSAQDGANDQIALCFSEMSAKCLETAYAAPACIAAGVIEIEASSKAGSRSVFCPIVNKGIETAFATAKGIVLIDLGDNLGKELNMRKNIL